MELNKNAVSESSKKEFNLYKENYVTVFDSNFLPQGLCLYKSLERQESDFVLWIICVDDLCWEKLNAIELDKIKLIKLSDVETRSLLDIKENRNKVEYIWTLSPFAPKFVFEQDPEVKRVTYLDADMYFMKSPKLLFYEFEKSGKAVMITPHNYAPQYDQSSKSGKYCVQFIIFKRYESENVRKWWETKCLEWCYQRVEENKFGDQKYLDQFPLKFKNYVHILEKKEYIQAPWNARIFESKDCLIYHFHGLRLIENKLGLILFSKGYKIPKRTLKNIYQIYFCELKNLYQKGLFEWIGQIKEINKLVAWSKELIFFMMIPIKIFRKPVLPRINYFKINNLT